MGEILDLYLDEYFKNPNIEEYKEFNKILNDFISSLDNVSEGDIETWLENKIGEYLGPSDSKKNSSEIIRSINEHEKNKESLEEAKKEGWSKESWFATKLQESTSQKSAQENAQYLVELDSALTKANDQLKKSLLTKSGTVNQNPSLDGYIAEQYHVHTFNMNAQANQSQYRAEALVPDGTTYAKNSVDIVIKDANGHVVRRYQSKYCKDARHTELAFESGDYRGQQKLVPEGQEITKKHSTVIEAPDGTKSKSLSKESAKELQYKAQSGKPKEFSWDDYRSRDVAIGIGKNATTVGLKSAACSIGMDIAEKIWNGEKIEGKEIAKKAITAGVDSGVKAAAAGALKVATEKGVLSAIPKGTPAGVIANIASVGIDDAKILYKMANGELGFKEGVEKIEETTVSAAAGIVAMGEGAAIGASIGMCLGPVGSAVGGFIGGTVAYIAGSSVGKAVVKGLQTVRDFVCDVASSVVDTVSSAVDSVFDFFFG